MRNIELKARLRGHAHALRVCEELGASPRGAIRQIDTYFRVPEGRLKIREAGPGRTELVFYRRPDVPGPKGCDYLLEAADASIKEMLAEALGILAVVEKVRTLYLWQNVRIHLDAVAGLGGYLEFEAVLSAEYDDADGHEKLQHLIRAFGLTEEDLIETSYLEMMLAAGKGER